MSLRRPLIALSLVAAAIITVVVLLNVRTARPAGSSLPSGPPIASATASEGLETEISPTVIGPAYDPTVSRSPTRDKPQSKVWYHDGLWWASLVDFETGEHEIWWLNLETHTWVDTETVVDERPYAREDVYADGNDLWVASAGSDETAPREAVEIRRFRYSPKQRTYEPVPDYPMRVTAGGVTAVTITRDSTGVLWVSFIAGERVQVIASDPTGLQWSDPFVIPGPHSAVAADQAAIVALDGAIGVMWSNQVEQGVFFARHRDGDPISTWGTTEQALSGTKIADDHLSVRALQRADGLWVYAVAKTSLDQVPSHDQQLPQVVLLARDPSGRWASYLVGRVADHHTRPILVLDEEHDRAIIFATSPFSGGIIYMKWSPLDQIRFPVGLGTPVIAEGAAADANNATSTRQPVSSETGLVVVASDDAAGQYLHVELGLDGRGAPQPAPQPPPSEPLLQATWDGARVSLSMADQGWLITPPDSRAVVVDEAGRRGVRLASASGSASRMCWPFRTIDTGSLVVSASLYVESAPVGDSPTLAVRGNGTELSGVRLLKNGHFAYRIGASRTQSATSWVPGRWYQMKLTVNLGAATYSWIVRPGDAPGAAPLVNVSGLPLLGAPSADEICISAPPQAAGSGLVIDAVDVIWERP